MMQRRQALYRGKRSIAPVNRLRIVLCRYRSRSPSSRRHRLLSSPPSNGRMSFRRRGPIPKYRKFRLVKRRSKRMSNHQRIPLVRRRLPLQRRHPGALPALERMRPETRRPSLNRRLLLLGWWPIFRRERESRWSARRGIGWRFTPDEAIRPALFAAKTQNSWRKRIKKSLSS